MLDSAAVARPDLVTGPVFKFTLQATKDEEPEFSRAYGVTAPFYGTTTAPTRLNTNDHGLERSGRGSSRKSSTLWGSEQRSEERRVGKECRSRGSPYH